MAVATVEVAHQNALFIKKKNNILDKQRFLKEVSNIVIAYLFCIYITYPFKSLLLSSFSSC